MIILAPLLKLPRTNSALSSMSYAPSLLVGTESVPAHAQLGKQRLRPPLSVAPSGSTLITIAYFRSSLKRHLTKNCLSIRDVARLLMLEKKGELLPSLATNGVKSLNYQRETALETTSLTGFSLISTRTESSRSSPQLRCRPLIQPATTAILERTPNTLTKHR